MGHVHRALGALIAALIVLAAPAAAQASYSVGAAKRSINPSQAEIETGTVFLGGYGFGANPITGGRSATGILGEGVSVRAFAVSDGKGGSFAIANMEMQGWFAALKSGAYGITDMRRAVERATGGELKASEVVIQSDHSHSAPDPMGVWGLIPTSYKKRIFDRTVDAVVEAWNTRRAGELRYGAVDAVDLLSNQFSWDEANQDLDGELRVLQARDAEGEALVTLVNFSAHTTVLGASNRKVSGDWVQALNPMLEDRLGGEAVTIVGTLGRTQPRDRGCTDATKTTADEKNLCALDQYAAQIAAKVDEALSASTALPAEAKVAARSYLIQDPSTNPVLLGGLAAGSAVGAPFDRSIMPPWMTGNVLGTVAATARIGDVLISSGPGEMYPQIPKTVREMVPNLRGYMTAGLANDQLGYIIAPFHEAYPGPICATFFEDCENMPDSPPTQPGALPNDNYFFNVSHTLGERLICAFLRGAKETLESPVDPRANREECAAFANDLLLPAGADVGQPTGELTDLLGNGKANGGQAGAIKAGVAVVDASYHVGAGSGQYASAFYDGPSENVDPHLMQTKQHPSHGMQSRLEARALVLEGADGKRFAMVKNDLYIPQDLLARRLAHILEDGDSGVTRETLTMTVTHDHSSPYYSSSAWGAWTFQDRFDLRFFEYYAQRMADAVEKAAADLRPVKVGASVGEIDIVHRHSYGPERADDGTPAGYPKSDADHDLTVVRFDDKATGKPYAVLANYSLHPEFLDGNNLISADYVAALQRIVDRETGAKLVFTQSSVGTAEPERSEWHDLHQRAEFSDRNYGQAEIGGRLIADEVIDTFDDIAAETPEKPERFVPFFDSAPVSMVDRWYPGPLSHPLPTVSNCRTDAAVGGDPRVPIVGLPDCQGGLESPVSPGVSTDELQRLGIPVPENYSAPSYTGLEEDVSVHMQAWRIGDILIAICSCEQWADQARNIKTRTNQERGDQYLGYDWSKDCTRNADGSWTCRHPKGPMTVSNNLYQRMYAQVHNDAKGWDFVENVPYAESEPPADRWTEIKGNFTHEELSPAEGYKLTIPVAMGNDYNGYIASYREYQMGDHYRKALTAWGPHSSDYYATRLTQLAGHLKTGDWSTPVLPTEPERELADAIGRAKTEVDMAHQDARTRALGAAAAAAIPAYEATLADDAGEPSIDVQPADEVQRFGAAHITWTGGSNYTDDPFVTVERKVGERWETFADQSGEIPVTVQYPHLDDGTLLDWATANFQWKWTATFEVMVSRVNAGDRPRATPPGTYRFLVKGKHRDGRAAKDYVLTSEEFQVQPWKGIQATDLRLEADRSLSFRLGPRNTYQAFGMSAEIGPIDYPDSYSFENKPAFIRHQRTAFRDPLYPNDPSKLEWYCFVCSFRPWEDVGDAETAMVTITRHDGTVEVVEATRSGDRWVTSATLGEGDKAVVEPGQVRDRWGNFNGAASNAVERPQPEPTVTPTPTGTATSVPTETATATPTETTTATPTETATVTATATPTETATATPTESATATPTRTATATPTKTATATPTKTPQGKPDDTPGPTATPTPGRSEDAPGRDHDDKGGLRTAHPAERALLGRPRRLCVRSLKLRHLRGGRTELRGRLCRNAHWPLRVAIARPSWDRCRFLTRSARLTARRRCSDERWMGARGRRSFRVLIRGRAPRGYYIVVIRNGDDRRTARRIRLR